jgi:hypothetical protein
MVGGHPLGAQRGHHMMEGCVAKWQEHCCLGVHPHPADPERADAVRLPSPAPVTPTAIAPTTAENCEHTRSGSDSWSSLSSVTATTWAEVPVIARYFTLWGGRIVYSDQ